MAMPSATHSGVGRRLGEVHDGAVRSAQVMQLLDELLTADPALSVYRAEMLMLARAALLADGVTALLPGEASDVTDAIDFPAPTAEEILADATLVAQVRHRIIGTPMLTSSAVSELLGSRSLNKRQYAHARRKSGELLAVMQGGQYLFPEFQFDVERGAVRAGVIEVNTMLGAADDPWGVASWWLHPHAALEVGVAPVKLLDSATGVAVLLELAEAESAPVG